MGKSLSGGACDMADPDQAKRDAIVKDSFGKDRAPWEKPLMTRIEMQDAEVGTSTGADALNTAGS